MNNHQILSGVARLSTLKPYRNYRGRQRLMKGMGQVSGVLIWTLVLSVSPTRAETDRPEGFREASNWDSFPSSSSQPSFSQPSSSQANFSLQLIEAGESDRPSSLIEASEQEVQLSAELQPVVTMPVLQPERFQSEWSAHGEAQLPEIERLSQRSSPDLGGEEPSEIDPPLTPEEPNLEAEPELEDASDPELGILRLREREREIETAVRRSPPRVFLIGRASYFGSDNILLDVDPVSDQTFRTGLSVFAAPRLGPRTFLLTSIEGNLVRYNALSDLDYNELRLRADIRQSLTPRVYGEIGWSNQQLFEEGGGDRFLDDHSLRLYLRRLDPLRDDLSLDSFYQLRFSFADPSDRSRIIQALGTSLDYDIQPNLQASLDYQFVFTKFTQQERDDLYNQLLARLSYDLSRNSSINLFAGFSFGGSSASDVDFNGSIFGVSFSVSVPLF